MRFESTTTNQMMIDILNLQKNVIDLSCQVAVLTAIISQNNLSTDEELGKSYNTLLNSPEIKPTMHLLDYRLRICEINENLDKGIFTEADAEYLRCNNIWDSEKDIEKCIKMMQEIAEMHAQLDNCS